MTRPGDVPPPHAPLLPSDPVSLQRDPRDRVFADQRRAYLPAGLVGLLAAAGIVYSTVVPQHWLRGVMVVAVALGLAAVFRATLPTAQAGLLAVRSRSFDVLCFAVLAVALVLFGIALPG